MENNKYVKLHSLLRMGAALFAIVVFIAMFSAKQVIWQDGSKSYMNFAFNSGAFFGTEDGAYKGNVIGFIAYLLVFLGGLAGLAFVFIDELIGKDLTKKLSFVVGGVMVLGALFIFLFAPIWKGLNNDGLGISNYHTAAGPIVFGCFALIAGAANIAAPILEDKGL